MSRVYTLGTSAALPQDERELTYLLVEGEMEAYLIDCAGGPLQRMLRVGLQMEKLQGLLVTHYHADHIYGLPALLTGLWLQERRQALHIYGPEQSIHVLQAIGESFGWSEWPHWLPVIYHGVSEKEQALVIDTPEFLITASPGRHLDMHTLAYRMRSKRTGGVMVYSSDSEPCESIVRLAREADLLIHEAAGEGAGHSSAAQAGSVARQAGARRLVMVHYPNAANAPQMVENARRGCSGQVEAAEDFSVYEFCLPRQTKAGPTLRPASQASITCF